MSITYWLINIYKSSIGFNYYSSEKWKWKSLSCVQLFVTVHGIPQARILEWVAFPFSRGSSQPRGWTQVSHTVGGFFTSWATGKPDKVVIIKNDAHISDLGNLVDDDDANY